MDEIYGVFKGHVTAIRGNRLKKPIDDLAGGRVYTGKQALELGLVDRLGTLARRHQVRRRRGQADRLRRPGRSQAQVVPRTAHGRQQRRRAARAWSGLAARVPTLIELAQPLIRSLDPVPRGPGAHGPGPARIAQPRRRHRDDAGAGAGKVSSPLCNCNWQLATACFARKTAIGSIWRFSVKSRDQAADMDRRRPVTSSSWPLVLISRSIGHRSTLPPPVSCHGVVSPGLGVVLAGWCGDGPAGEHAARPGRHTGGSPCETPA